MGSTLTNGIYLPAEGERNCYEGLAANWTALDRLIGGYNAHVGNATIHVTAAEKETWNGKADASALTAHTGDTTIHVTAEDKETWNGHIADSVKHVTAEDKQAWNGKADASALTAHTGDTTIHVTAADKQAWNGKADASALTAHTGDTTIHVTAADKAKWDAVTSKADDSDVVHSSGNETIAGEKTFTSVLIASRNTTNGEIILQNASYDPKTNGQSGVSTKSFSIRFATALSDTFGAVSCYGANNRTILRFTSRYFVDAQTVIEDSVEYTIYSDEARSFRPRNNNNCLLGESTRRWKDVNTYLVNGLEPSSLFLPSDRSARIDISSYFTDTGTGQSNSYTVPANGYIYLTLSELTNVHCFSRTSGNVINYAQTFTKPNNSTGALYVLFPVRKNDVFVATWYTTTTVSVDGAFFIPCKGNI